MHACDKERALLHCEYCDCVDLGNWMELFGIQALGNGGGSGVKQNICILLWSKNHVLLWVGDKVVAFMCSVWETEKMNVGLGETGK